MQLTSDTKIAIVGVSTNPQKYGQIVFKDLKEAGYQVIPINPNTAEILGSTAYPSLKAYQGEIDLVVFVVPPKITEKVLKEVKELEIDRVWFQPGSESQKAIQFCQENDIQMVVNACIMKKGPDSKF